MHHQARKHPQEQRRPCNSQCAFAEWFHVQTSRDENQHVDPNSVTSRTSVSHFLPDSPVCPTAAQALVQLFVRLGPEPWALNAAMPRERLEGCCTTCVLSGRNIYWSALKTCFGVFTWYCTWSNIFSDAVNYSVIILLQPLDLSWPFSWIPYFLRVFSPSSLARFVP